MVQYANGTSVMVQL